ncbi:YvrJ family protein [Enterococcus mundtii]|uniref:YvrJ family protein n=1 Tax=Enterococcus mundtii TaxID=53346 RepID=UPI003970E13C
MIEGFEFVQIIGNFGFPVAITIYLLVRFEGKIDKLRESIDDLSDNVSKIKWAKNNEQK